jgi:hypothetical protein
MSSVKSNELIGNGTRDLPAYIIVSQPTTLPRASNIIIVNVTNIFTSVCVPKNYFLI